MSKIVKENTIYRRIVVQIRHTIVQADDGQCYLISSTVTTDHGLETMVFPCKQSEDNPDEYSADWGELWSAHYTDWYEQEFEHDKIVENFESFKNNGFQFRPINN